MRISDWSSDVCSSDLLFEMSHRHPPTDRLVKRAIPILEALAAETEQSCHLAVLHDDMALILATGHNPRPMAKSEEHTSELQSLMRISYAVFCLKKKTTKTQLNATETND